MNNEKKIQIAVAVGSLAVTLTTAIWLLRRGQQTKQSDTTAPVDKDAESKKAPTQRSAKKVMIQVDGEAFSPVNLPAGESSGTPANPHRVRSKATAALLKVCEKHRWKPDPMQVARCVQAGADVCAQQHGLFWPVLHRFIKDGNVECVAACLGKIVPPTTPTPGADEATSQLGDMENSLTGSTSMRRHRPPRGIDFTVLDEVMEANPLHYTCYCADQDSAREILEMIVERLQTREKEMVDWSAENFGGAEDVEKERVRLTDVIDWSQTDCKQNDFFSLAARSQRLALFWDVVKKLPYFQALCQREPKTPIVALTRSVWEWDWEKLGPSEQVYFTLRPVGKRKPALVQTTPENAALARLCSENNPDLMDADTDAAEVQKLVESGADIFFKNPDTDRPILHTFIHRGQVDCVRGCLRMFAPSTTPPVGIDFTVTLNSWGSTPLHGLCYDMTPEAKALEMLKAIVQHMEEHPGLDVVDWSQKDRLGSDFITCAAEAKRVSLFWPVLKNIPYFNDAEVRRAAQDASFKAMMAKRKEQQDERLSTSRERNSTERSEEKEEAGEKDPDAFTPVLNNDDIDRLAEEKRKRKKEKREKRARKLSLLSGEGEAGAAVSAKAEKREPSPTREVPAEVLPVASTIICKLSRSDWGKLKVEDRIHFEVKTDPTSDRLSTTSVPQTLQELNAAKVNHLLDYLDKAAINAIQAAEATNKAATLAAAAAATASSSYSSGVGVGSATIGVGSHSSSAPLVSSGLHPHSAVNPTTTAGLRRSSSRREEHRCLRESDELGGGTGTDWESSSQSQNISGPPHGGGGAYEVPPPRPFDSERSVLLSAPSTAQIGVAYHERDAAPYGNPARRSATMATATAGRHRDPSSRKKRVSSTIPTNTSSTAPASSVQTRDPLSAGLSPAPYASSSPNSIQNVFLELKEKMDRMRYDKDCLQQEKDLLLEQLEASKERERQLRSRYAAQAEEEVQRAKKELHRAKKEHKHQMESLQEECNAHANQVEELSRQLRLELQGREEERQRMEAAHTTALELLQAKYASKERLAREKWREQEAKKIKATTLQSLEPDIVMLLQRHKADKSRMEEDFARVIREREREMKDREAVWEERLRQLRHDFEQQRETEAATREREASRRLQEEQQKHQRHAEDALLAAKQEWESAHKTQLHQLQERYAGQQRQEREEFEAEMSKLRQEVQRLRTQYSSELLHATQIVHQEEESKRLHWQEDFMKRTREEVSHQYEQELQQKVQEAERILQERLTRERDLAVTTVLNSLQQEHETEEERRRQERQRERESFLQTQRSMEYLRVERDDYRQQLQACVAERDALQLRCKDASEKLKQCESKEKAREEEVSTNLQLQERLLSVELERQQQVLKTQHAQEMALLEAQFKERERQLQHQHSVLEEEKRSLVQQHHEELRKIQERVMETVRAKEEAMREMQRRAALLEQTLREREEGWAAQQAMLLQA